MTTVHLTMNSFPSKSAGLDDSGFNTKLRGDISLLDEGLQFDQFESTDKSHSGEYQDKKTKDKEGTFDTILEETEKETDQIPCIVLLTFNSQQTNIFTRGESSQMPLFHDKCSLFRSPLNAFMEALQTNFSIKNDVALFFPQLKLRFYTHMPFNEKLSLLDLYFLASKVSPTNQKSVLLIELFEEKYNFVAQYSHLLSITDELESSDDEDEISGVEDIIDLECDNTTDLYENTFLSDEEYEVQTDSLLTKRKRTNDPEHTPKRMRLQGEME